MLPTFFQLFLSITGNDCKTKWKSIRSSYIRSLNSKSKSGSGAGSKKEYYLTPHLRFLNPFTKNRTQEGNISETQNSSHHNDSENSNFSNVDVFNHDFNSQDEFSSATSLSATHTMDNSSSPSLRSPTEPHSIVTHQPNMQQYREKELVPSTSSPSPEPCTNTHTPSSSIYKNQPKKSMPLSAVDKCAIEYFSLKKQKTELKRHEPLDKDPCELFLLSLVPQMQSMTPREQLTFQKGILNLVENIKYPSQEPIQQQSIILFSGDLSSNNATTSYYQNFSNEVQNDTSTQSPPSPS